MLLHPEVLVPILSKTLSFLHMYVHYVSSRVMDQLLLEAGLTSIRVAGPVMENLPEATLTVAPGGPTTSVVFIIGTLFGWLAKARAG